MSASPFDWNDLEIFLATARGGSLAAASTELRIDASTVQRRIGKLEAAMRTRLFDRSPRGYAVTPAGEDLLAHTLAMEEQVVRARRRIVGRDDTLAGTVRIATVDDLAIHVLSPILKKFRDAHPNVTVSVELRSNMTDLARQQADVAIRLGSTPPRGDLIAKQIARIQGAFYASRDYLRKHGTPKKLEDLRDHFIVRGDVTQTGMPMERIIERWVDPDKTAFRSESFHARWAAIRDGMGVGFLGVFMGDADKTLKRVLPLPDVGVGMYLVVHVDMRKNARVRAFVEHTYAELVALRPRFEGHAKA